MYTNPQKVAIGRYRTQQHDSCTSLLTSSAWQTVGDYNSFVSMHHIFSVYTQHGCSYTKPRAHDLTEMQLCKVARKLVPHKVYKREILYVCYKFLLFPGFLNSLSMLALILAFSWPCCFWNSSVRTLAADDPSLSRGL